MRQKNSFLTTLFYATLGTLTALISMEIGWRWWLRRNGTLPAPVLPPEFTPEILPDVEPVMQARGLSPLLITINVKTIQSRLLKILAVFQRLNADISARLLPYQPYIAVIRLLLLPVIIWLAYEAQTRFEAFQDDGFRWLAAGGILLMLIVPALSPLPQTLPVNLNIAGRKRQIFGGLLWLTGTGLLIHAARLFIVLKPDEIPDATPWNIFGVGLLLWIAGGFIFTRSEIPPAPAVTVWVPAMIFALAIFLRVYEFENQPRGIWYDEAVNGIEARKILEDTDYRPTFVPNITAPHLFLYAIGLEFFGETSMVGPRLLSVIFGVGTVILAYQVGKLLRGVYFGLLFALLMAVMRWSINFSRIAMTGIEMGFFILLALYFLIRLTRYGQLRDAMLVGLSIGAGLWFYSAFRLLALTLVIYGLLAWRRWPSWKMVLLIVVAGLSALAVIFPLAIYARTNSETFLGRTRTVSILSEEVRGPDRSFEDAFRSNLEKHARMFHIRGDNNGRHNDPGEPMLDPYTGLLFGLGLVLSFRFLHRPESLFFISVLAIGLSGGVLTLEFEAPQGLRSIGVQPALGYFAALAAWAMGYTLYRSLDSVINAANKFSGYIMRRRYDTELASTSADILSHSPAIYWRAIAAVSGVMLAILVTQANYTAYFEKQRRDFSSFYEFSISETLMGEYAARQPENTEFYVSPLLAYTPTTEFIDARSPDWQILPLPGGFPLQIAPENPVTVFLHFLDTQLYDYARQIYPDAELMAVSPSDYGVEQPDAFPVLFYIVTLQPEDIASVQGLAETDNGAEGYLFAPYYGEYRFWFAEGATVTINHQTLRERGESITLPEGNIPITVEPANAALEWITPDDDRLRPIPRHYFYHAPVNDNGLLAEFYPNENWQGEPLMKRITPDIHWRIHVLPLSRPYSVRWTGTLVITEPGEYVFQLEAAYYGEVYLNGELLVKTEVTRQARAARLPLEAGTYDIEVKFQDKEDYSGIYLRWMPPRTNEFVPIPREHFRPEKFTKN